MKTESAIQNKIANSHFPVVAIGTAATEIDLLKKILSDFPSDSGMAYVVFENLFSPQTNELAEILSLNTKIPVVEIVHNVDIQPNTIYIIPKNNFWFTKTAY